MPDEEQWSVVSSSDSTQWFNETKYIDFLGDDNSAGSFAWDGDIDLTNTWLDRGSLLNGKFVYDIQWEALDKV